MKNKKISSIILNTCYKCKAPGLFCETPCGADWITCPICGCDDFYNKLSLSNRDDDIKLYNKIEKYFEVNEKRYVITFCENCLILFQTGFIHHEYGCTDSIYTGFIISKWKNKFTGKVYNGMPKFKSVDDWYRNCFSHVEILEWHCPTTGKFFKA